MEEGHLVHPQPTGHDHLVDVSPPGIRGRRSQILIESDPGLLHLRALPQAWGRPGHNTGTACLPILQEGPMRYVWRDEMSDRADPVELRAERFVIARR